MSAQLLVLGCVATKGPLPVAAKDLYCSQLWLGRRRYAEASGLPWKVFSARHGLIDPDRIIEPYDWTFPGPYGWREKLSKEAAADIFAEGFRRVEIHAGERYTSDLVPILRRLGVEVLLPLEHLGIGEQLHWYAEKRTENATAP